jgi:rhamnose transport system permease protein
VLIVQFGLPSLAVTIGTLGLYRGLAYMILGDRAVTGLPESYRPLAIDFGILVVVAVGGLVAVAVHLTPLGRSLYAIGLGEQTARFSGIRVDRVKMMLFVTSSALAALASLIYTLRYNSARADNGSGLELAAVAAVLLGGVSIFGGRGTVLGVATALLVMAGLRNAMFLNDVSNEIQNVITGLLLIISVLVPASMRRIRDGTYPLFASRSAGRAARRRLRRNHEGVQPAGGGWSGREQRGSEQADQAGPQDRISAQGDRQPVHDHNGRGRSGRRA